MSIPHQLKIVPTNDKRGFWLVSNGRIWFCDLTMLAEISNGILEVLGTGQEYRNYEEPKSSPMPFQPLRSNSLDDLL